MQQTPAAPSVSQVAWQEVRIWEGGLEIHPAVPITPQAAQTRRSRVAEGQQAAKAARSHKRLHFCYRRGKNDSFGLWLF